jgi:hypothetical protein
MGDPGPTNESPLPGNDIARALIVILVLATLAIFAVFYSAHPLVSPVWTADVS